MRNRRSAAERPRNPLAMRCLEAGPVMLIRSVETVIPNQFAEPWKYLYHSISQLI